MPGIVLRYVSRFSKVCQYTAILFLLCGSVAHGRTIEQEIMQLVQNRAGDVNVGVYFRNLRSGATVVSIHPDRLFLPASSMKVLSAYMALKMLGPDYRFRTLFQADAKPQDGVLQSSLVIKFVGDPSLKYDDLRTAVRDMKLSAIEGDIIIDDSMFDDRTTSAGGFTWDNLPFYYAAPVSAIVVDKNCADAFISTKAERAQGRVDRPSVLVMEHKVAVSNEDCPYTSRYLGHNRYLVEGCLPRSKHEHRLNFALQDVRKMASSYVKQILLEERVKLSGSIRFDRMDGKNTIAFVQSPPLRDIVKHTLMNSCNVSAAAVFKHVAAVKIGAPGTDKNAAALLAQFLERDCGVSSRLFEVHDGSGKSRYNLIAPLAFVNFLGAVHSDGQLGQLFMESLCQYGHGTLSSRSIKDGGIVRAKTGWLEHNSALTGFYSPHGDNEPTYAFAIMLGNHRLDSLNAGRLIDEILQRVIDGLRAKLPDA